MSENTYDGDPIDVSWQDFKNRPYGGQGKTVDVVDNLSDSGRSEFHIPAEFSTGEKTANVLELIEQSDKKQSTKQIAERVEITKRGTRNALQELSKIGVVYCEELAGKWGADLWVPVVDTGDLYVFPDGINSDILPTSSHPVQLTQTQRVILSYAVKNPTRTQTHIADSVGVSQPTVCRTLEKHGDPRKEINELEVGHASAKINVITNRIRHFEDRIEELKSERSDLKRTVNQGAKDV